MALTRADLTKAQVVERKIEALDDVVYLRKLTAGEMLTLEGDNIGRILALSLCESEDGEPMFDESEDDEALAIGMEAVNAIMENINEINDFDPEAVEGN